MLQNFWIGLDVNKLLTSLPTGNAAVRAVVESQLKNLKALDEANQHAIDAFHGLFQRQSEALHQTLAEVCAAMTAQPDATGGDATAQQTALARTATERALANMRDISETVAQASQKAGEVINNRIQENIAELHKLGGKQS